MSAMLPKTSPAVVLFRTAGSVIAVVAVVAAGVSSIETRFGIAVPKSGLL